MQKQFIYIRFLALLVVMLVLQSCKETETPENPYDNVDYNSGTGSSGTEPAANSITGLHKNIFIKRCALSGCHDGTFEPDFRTVQSSYATLVYHPVIKTTVNNVDSFYLRVIPNDYQNSFLYERITTTTTEYMPSNGTRLGSTDIDNIKSWIQNGARDENGNLPVKPNLQPNILFYVAVDTTFFINRYDTTRVDGIGSNPFIIPANTNFNIVYFCSDAMDGADSTAVIDFTNCHIKCSTDKNDFSSAVSFSSTPPFGLSLWSSTLSSGQWPVGTTVYFRMYVNDGDHAADAEFPRNESPDYYKTYYAFKVQ